LHEDWRLSKCLFLYRRIAHLVDHTYQRCANAGKSPCLDIFNIQTTTITQTSTIVSEAPTATSTLVQPQFLLQIVSDGGLTGAYIRLTSTPLFNALAATYSLLNAAVFTFADQNTLTTIFPRPNWFLTLGIGSTLLGLGTSDYVAMNPGGLSTCHIAAGILSCSSSGSSTLLFCQGSIVLTNGPMDNCIPMSLVAVEVPG
jgi:hypothetical protein